MHWMPQIANRAIPLCYRSSGVGHVYARAGVKVTILAESGMAAFGGGNAEPDVGANLNRSPRVLWREQYLRCF